MREDFFLAHLKEQNVEQDDDSYAYVHYVDALLLVST
jgi:hypothetical protein